MSSVDRATVADDRQLAQRAQAGDELAFASLVDSYGERIYNMLLHMCNGDSDMASELTQEAFVRAYERLDQFDGRSSFYTWLYRLARNRAIDVRKRKKPLASDPHEMHDPGELHDPAAAMEQQDMQCLVQTALAAIDDEQREIILLRDFDGHDYAHIAELLDIAEGTVKSRLSRARKALREQITALPGCDQLIQRASS